MKKIKKVLALATLALVMCFVGCADPEKTDSSGNGSAESATKFTDTVMAENGNTDYTIVLPADASECVWYAAEELNEYFSQSTLKFLSVKI